MRDGVPLIEGTNRSNKMQIIGTEVIKQIRVALKPKIELNTTDILKVDSKLNELGLLNAPIRSEVLIPLIEFNAVYRPQIHLTIDVDRNVYDIYKGGKDREIIYENVSYKQMVQIVDAIIRYKRK